MMKSRELETWDDDMPTAASSDISDPAEAPSDVDLDGINPVLLRICEKITYTLDCGFMV